MEVAEAVCSEKQSPFENESLFRRATVRLVEEMNSRLLIQLNDVVQVFMYCFVLVALDGSTESIVPHVCYKSYPSSLI
jgi:hypothetical protein